MSTASRITLLCLVAAVLAACTLPSGLQQVGRPAQGTLTNPSLTRTSGGQAPLPSPAFGPTPTFVPLPSGFPRIARRPSAASWPERQLTALPHYDPSSSDPFQVDLRRIDLTTTDLRLPLETMLLASFDTHTRWPSPDRLPSGFDPPRVLDLGKNPGLGIRRLHAQGITGRNVGIAIIDQTLLVDHQEYVDRLQVYEETTDIRDVWLESQMHASAVASIAVGRTVGVAPEADLYFIATAMCRSAASPSPDFACLARSVYRILEINAGLPPGPKIRVLSISMGWSPQDRGYAEMTAAARAARDSGLLVICPNTTEIHGLRFEGLGRDPRADPDAATSYAPPTWWVDQLSSRKPRADILFVPMDSRTLASPVGLDDYAFYRFGGWSWSIPYIAGMYALAAQARPDITPEMFWSAALKSGTTIPISSRGHVSSLGPILEPEALLAMLRQQ